MIDPTTRRKATSYVIRDRETKRAQLEFYNPKLIDSVNTDKYEVVTIGQHLAEQSHQDTK